jgi:hypothetical protein
LPRRDLLRQSSEPIHAKFFIARLSSRILDFRTSWPNLSFGGKAPELPLQGVHLCKIEGDAVVAATLA